MRLIITFADGRSSIEGDYSKDNAYRLAAWVQAKRELGTYPPGEVIMPDLQETQLD